MNYSPFSMNHLDRTRRSLQTSQAGMTRRMGPVSGDVWAPGISLGQARTLRRWLLPLCQADLAPVWGTVAIHHHQEITLLKQNWSIIRPGHFKCDRHGMSQRDWIVSGDLYRSINRYRKCGNLPEPGSSRWLVEGGDTEDRERETAGQH